MTFIPKKDLRRTVPLCLLFLTLALCLFFLSSVLPFSTLFQLFGALFLVSFLFVWLRYGMCEYRYELAESTLKIFRKQSRREEELASIDLTATVSVTDRKTYQKEKPAHRLRYNFCRNFLPEREVFLLFVFDDSNDRRALVTLEIDEAFADALKAFVPSTKPDNA